MSANTPTIIAFSKVNDVIFGFPKVIYNPTVEQLNKPQFLTTSYFVTGLLLDPKQLQVVEI